MNPDQNAGSRIGAMILDRSFSYLQPYFYRHPFALRCELGIGDDDETYMKNAEARAEAIFGILFPDGPDAVFFNDYVTDRTESGDADVELSPEEAEAWLRDRIGAETARLRFLMEYQMKYRHIVVRGLELPDPGLADVILRRNRVVCYPDGKKFDCRSLIRRQLTDPDSPEISFVSFRNECILSVYDDRGCDAVFAEYDKMAEFYPKLEPFFLPYDAAEMKRRLERRTADGMYFVIGTCQNEDGMIY